MDAAFDRAFSKAFAKRRQQSEKIERGETGEQEEEPVSLTELEKILSLFHEKDYFSCLKLPYPTHDALGRPVWDVSNGEISRAFRKVSLGVHPDKNPDPKAQEAFEALNQSQRILKDPAQQAELVKDFAARKKDKGSWTGTAEEVEKQVKATVVRNEQARNLRKVEGASFANEIQKQQKRSRAMAQLRKEGKLKREGSDSDSDSDSSEKETKPVVVKRKKPKFLI